MCSLKRNQRIVRSTNLLAAQKGVPGQPPKLLSKVQLGDPKKTPGLRTANSRAVKKHHDAVRRAVEVLAAPNAVTSGPVSTQMSTGKAYNYAISQATPYTTLYDWITGTGPRTRVFRDRDVFTEILKDHHWIDHVKDRIARLIREGNDYRDNNLNNYSLTGWKAIPYFFIDVDNVMHGLTRYNSAMTFLGGFGLNYKVVSINRHTHTAEIEFHVWNISSIHSATRLPYVSTTRWWQENVNPTVVPWMQEHFATGPLSNIQQDFYWTDAVLW